MAKVELLLSMHYTYVMEGRILPCISGRALAKNRSFCNSKVTLFNCFYTEYFILARSYEMMASNVGSIA